MGSRLTFSVESQARQYAVLELYNGCVSAKMGRAELHGVMLAHAVQWVKEHNPDRGSEAQIRLLSAS